MLTVNQKIRIVESLDSLEPNQGDKVLSYIKNLLYREQDDQYEKFKEEAIVEIQKALLRSQQGAE